MPSKLLSLQWKFSRMVANLIIYGHELGYEFTFGEAYRTPTAAALNEKSGVGIKHSTHTVRLAVDLNVFKDDVYLTEGKQFKELGEFWKSLGGSWGGDFKVRPDGNHFSIAFDVNNDGIVER